MELYVVIFFFSICLVHGHFVQVLEPYAGREDVGGYLYPVLYIRKK